MENISKRAFSNVLFKTFSLGCVIESVSNKNHVKALFCIFVPNTTTRLAAPSKTIIF